MVKEQNKSIREAAQLYGIPKSTLHDHCSGKAKSRKPGPSPYLTEAEEQKLVEWAIEMGKIGYGWTREQMTMVKNLLDKDGRQNPFVNNRPGKDWWYAFAIARSWHCVHLSTYSKLKLQAAARSCPDGTPHLSNSWK